MRLPDPAYAAVSLAAAEAWLWLVALPALRDAGDPTGLPLAAWILPLGAAVAPWALPSRSHRSRGAQALAGQLACVLGAGVMVVHPWWGAVAALTGIGAAAISRGAAGTPSPPRTPR